MSTREWYITEEVLARLGAVNGGEELKRDEAVNREKDG